jgi:DNA processing protein
LLDADEFAAWFRLLETPGLGREAARRLLASFGSAAQVLRASKSAWQQVVGAQLAQALDT